MYYIMYNTSVIQGVCGVCGVWGVPCFFLEVCFQYANGVLSVSSHLYQVVRMYVKHFITIYVRTMFLICQLEKTCPLQISKECHPMIDFRVYVIYMDLNRRRRCICKQFVFLAFWIVQSCSTLNLRDSASRQIVDKLFAPVGTYLYTF